MAQTLALALADGVTLPDKLVSLLGEMSGWVYGWDYKIQPLSLQGAELVGTLMVAQDGEAEGTEAKRVDCSGFSRWALYHLSGDKVAVPDGSVQQHQWFHANGFDTCPVADGHLTDGALRIFFLPPVGKEAGHVMLVFNGMTYESHGSAGPSSRSWGSQPFMHSCSGYVVAPA